MKTGRELVFWLKLIKKRKILKVQVMQLLRQLMLMPLVKILTLQGFTEVLKLIVKVLKIGLI